MIQLLALCGGATTIMGLLFGGYAGIENVPEFLLSFQIFDMNSGINSVMAFAYILGFIHLWFGTLIAGVHKWKQGEKREAFYLHFSWTIFFILIAFSFLGEDATISSLLRNIALVFLFLSLSYDAVWYLKPVKGLIMLMNEGVSWLSQVLSYTRLFALGLSTGVVALVFNQLAVIIGDMLPSGIGMVVMVIFILAGHLLNIAMNLLGAYIHSARLQFVEFFSKFLEGGGRKFAPFTRSSAYVYVENK
jgi:V/A-type H+-transporting ATPase subunit I